jgi:acetylornithine deacetylase/succinyl-diaminopimelate desuccinylase-like protein
LSETAGRAPIAEAKRVVLAKINELRGEAIDLLARMIRIPSPNPPGNEKAIANFNADYMRRQGLSVTQIEPFENRVSNVGRLVGRKNGKKTLLFNSHLDTVALGNPAEWEHPMLGGEIHDDMIWGIGAKNMKSGMAAAMFLPRLFKAANIDLDGDLLLSQTADEMLGGFKGLKLVIDNNLLQADYGIYTETGIPPRIEVGHRGRVDIMITTKGRSGHTSEPAANKKINAVVKMCKVIEAVSTMEFSDWLPHSLLEGKPILSVNLIEGGYSEIMVPDKCVIHCDVRTLPPQTPQTVLADVEAVIDRLVEDDPELDATAEIAYEAPYSFIPLDSPIVGEVQKAIVEVTGKKMPVLASPATSDSRWLVLHAKIPTCKFSFTTVGSGPNERLRVDSYLDMVRVYAMVAMNTLYDV